MATSFSPSRSRREGGESTRHQLHEAGCRHEDSNPLAALQSPAWRMIPRRNDDVNSEDQRGSSQQPQHTEEREKLDSYKTRLIEAQAYFRKMQARIKNVLEKHGTEDKCNCGKKIYWIHTKSGVSIPYDKELNDHMTECGQLNLFGS